MNDLLAARSQMAMSLGVHIVFAAIGIGLPLLMVVAEGLWRRTGDARYRTLTNAWSRGLAVLFAVGAVSGTVLSFELGLLWPAFMRYAGPLIGFPFSLEGVAFFLEGIFIGVYLYGWKRVSPRVHWLSGVLIAVSGAASGVFVLSVNGWMNAPTGFTPAVDGPRDVAPLAAMLNPFWLINAVHMLLAAYIATGFGVATIHAWRLLRAPDSAIDRAALVIALTIGGTAALLQPITGDLTGRLVEREQPAKLAAMESVYATGSCIPLHIGGIPDSERQTVRFGLEIPCGLSLLLHFDRDAVIQGLDQVPRQDWPNVPIVHASFQVMVGIGFLLVGLAIWSIPAIARARFSPRLLRALLPAGPLAFLAIEAGWVVTEVGRQPWIIYGVMRTRDAVTPMPGLAVPFLAFTALYAVLVIVVAALLRREIRELGS